MHISDEQNTKSSALCAINHVLTQMVEALHHKAEGCGLESRWCH